MLAPKSVVYNGTDGHLGEMWTTKTQFSTKSLHAYTLPGLEGGFEW